MGISISSDKIIRVLKEHGFTLKSIRGSHYKYIKGNKTAIVKHPKKDIPRGTLSSIVDMSGLLLEDFIK
jgi:predicted RNA binding protein YcfA (HicA-like mRNA interferase family)